MLMAKTCPHCSSENIYEYLEGEPTIYRCGDCDFIGILD